MNIGASSRGNIWWVPTAPVALKPRAHPDRVIAEAAAHALRWKVSSGGVSAAVENGWVTLSGQAATASEKAAAERAVYYLLGVRGIRNEIIVRPPSPPLLIRPVHIEQRFRVAEA